MKFTVPDETEQITVKQFLRKNCEMSARTLAKLKRCENGIMLGEKQSAPVSSVA